MFVYFNGKVVHVFDILWINLCEGTVLQSIEQHRSSGNVHTWTETQRSRHQNIVDYWSNQAAKNVMFIYYLLN